IANTTVSLTGDTSRQQITDINGAYSFTTLARGGKYTVTPGIELYNFDFASRSYNPLLTDVTDADFIAQPPTYFLTGSSTKGAVGLANIRVDLEGTNIPPDFAVQTTANGNYTFSNLTIRGDYKVTPSSSNYTFDATILPGQNFYSFPTLGESRDNVNFN